MEQQQVSSAICSSVLVHIKHQGAIREKRMIMAKKTQNLGETEKSVESSWTGYPQSTN